MSANTTWTPEDRRPAQQERGLLDVADHPTHFYTPKGRGRAVHRVCL
jgi:hypothetical protein